MIIDRRMVGCHRVLGPALLTIGIGLSGGCGSIPGTLDSASTSGIGPKEGTAAFEKQVQDDRFPTAAQALAESSLTAQGGMP